MTQKLQYYPPFFPEGIEEHYLLQGPHALLVFLVPGFDGLRVPARFVVVVALALGVLGSAGASWLLGRTRPRLAAAVAVATGLALTLEGYGGSMHMTPFRPDQPSRAGLDGWLRESPPGGVLELPIAGPALEPFTLVYQYNTLRHGHPIVNGFSGYGYGLQDFLGGPGSPLREPDALPGLLAGLRAIGSGAWWYTPRSSWAGRSSPGRRVPPPPRARLA